MSATATALGVDVVWSYVSLFQVAEGVIAVALLVLLAAAIESSGFGSLFDSAVFRGHLKSPLSYLFAFLGVLGVLSFLLLGLCGMRRVCDALDVNGWNVVQYPLGFLGSMGGSAFGPGGRMGYGALALLTWAATIVLLSLAGGLARAVKYFALPSLLFLTASVLLFDPGEMSSQAVNLASDVAFDGVSLLSNWFLFTVSLFFTVFGLAHGRLGLSGPARTARARPRAGNSLVSGRLQRTD